MSCRWSTKAETSRPRRCHPVGACCVMATGTRYAISRPRGHASRSAWLRCCPVLRIPAHTDGPKEPKTNTTHASLLGRSAGGEEPGPFAPCHRQRVGHLAHHSDEVRQGHQPACVWWGLCSKRQRPKTDKIACQFTLTFSLDNNTRRCAWLVSQAVEPELRSSRDRRRQDQLRGHS